MKKYISIQEWYEQNEQIAYYSAIFDKEVTDFYAWTISKDNNLLIGAALEINDNNDANVKFEVLKKKLIKYGYNLGKLVKRGSIYFTSR